MMRFWGKGVEPGGFVALDKEEARHAKVLRVREGEAVELLDGAGNFWRGVFEKGGVRVAEVGRAEPPACRLTLAVGLTQAGAFDLVVRQAVELGVARLVPLVTKNSAPTGGREMNKLERWRKIVDEACKQSGNRWRMEVCEPVSLESFLARAKEGVNVVAALAEGCVGWGEIPDGRELTVWVGPEGGFAQAEHEALRAAGAKFVSLGGTVLRVETACVALVARVSL